jgi:hypothetical protein
MKKLTMFAALVFILSLASVCQAADSATIDVSAYVDPSIELTWGMAKVDSMLTADPGDDVFTGSQTVMDYGTLTHFLADGTTDAGTWYSRYYYAVFMSAITGGAKYQLQSQSDGLFSGGVKLPKAWAVKSVSCWDSIADASITCPTGSAVADPQSAEGTVILYDSGAQDTSTIGIRADYAIPGYNADASVPFTGFEPVPVNQNAGTYAGQVRITVVAY